MGETRTVSEAVSVPFVDLGRSHAPLKAAILEDIAALIDSSAFTNGPQVAEFESAFADYCGTRFCVGLASGLDALRFALIALDLKPGDEVIVPANTFIASVEAITQAGATPVLVDASESDWNIDVAAVEAAITPRTRAVMPVHLYGQMADMVALRAVAARHGLAIVEDACQAHGATREGLRAGACGTAAAFSFYPGKNLGAMGDAGALVTDDEELADIVRSLRQHGERAKYEHERAGYTARLDTIQALVLLRKLPALDEWNRERRAAAGYYLAALESVGDLALPPVPPGSDPVWHLFVVRTGELKELADRLRVSGIGTGRHYPAPVHLTRAFASSRGGNGQFPVAERLARECLSLPMFPEITRLELASVTSAVGRFFEFAAGGRDEQEKRRLLR